MILITIFANCAALAAYQPLPEQDSSSVNEELVSKPFQCYLRLLNNVTIKRKNIPILYT